MKALTLNRPASRLDALTGARFIAAFHVFIFHAWAARGLPMPIRKVEDSGHMAVAFFFVLSGFILTVTYGKRGRFSIKDFAIARFARIYPLYALCLIVAAGLYIRSTGHGPGFSNLIVWFESCMLVQNWFPVNQTALSGPAWTLSAEAFFYITFPLLLSRIANWSRTTVQTSLIVVSVVYTVLRWMVPEYSSLALFRLPDFLIGILFGRLYLLGVLQSQERKAARLFWIAFVLTLVAPQFFPLQSEKPGGIMAPLFGAIVLALANTDALPAPFLRSRAMVFLGGASYALYLFHGYVLYGTNVLFESFHRSRIGSGVAFAFAASVGSIALASALFVFVEEPARGWIRRRLIPRRSAEATTLQAEPL